MTIKITNDERALFRVGATMGLNYRIGDRSVLSEENEFTGLSLPELTREALRRANLPIDRSSLSQVSRALTTSDLPNILSNVTKKILFDAFRQADESWRQWVAVKSAKDFKEFEIPSLSAADDLLEVPEGAEYRYGDLADRKESTKLITFGRIMRLTRQAIINDDLGALMDMPMKLGEAAARKIGDVVYQVLTDNGNMSDGNSLFDATNHSNMATGGGISPLGISALAAGIESMKKQTDENGVRLQIRPRYYIAPVASEGISEVFFGSDKFADSDTVATDSSLASTRVNPYAGDYFTRVYDARLDDKSEKYWYLAGPMGQTVNVYGLYGDVEPFIEQKQGFNTDSIEWKVRLDAVAKAVDWRALYLNPDV